MVKRSAARVTKAKFIMRMCFLPDFTLLVATCPGGS